MSASDTARDPNTFYVAALQALSGRVPFLVGGAYALSRYTGIFRDTKDLDVFVHPRDVEAALEALGKVGYRTELTFSHWLGKAFSGEHVIDVIFSSGNGFAQVDDAWFEHAVPDTVLGLPVLLCPTEEMIWSKAFIMERERYDGADIAHLLRARAGDLNWRRLLQRFGPCWRVLLSHLVLFGFIYPSERGRIPSPVMTGLIRRLAAEERQGPATHPVCFGTMLSRAQYLVDIDTLGYGDARIDPACTMTVDEIAEWTAAIEAPTPILEHPSPTGDAAGRCR